MEDSFKFTYIKDGLLYELWKYFNGRRFFVKDLLNFEDIRPIQTSAAVCFREFLDYLSFFDVELSELTFHKDVYFQYEGGQKGEEINELEPHTRKAIENILGNTFNKQDVEKAYPVLGRLNLIDYFEFKNELPKKTASRISDFLNAYIDDFIKDRVQIERHNFYRFDEQKSVLLHRIESYEEKYGNQFILEHDPNDFYITNDFLFIHTLIALEKLGYFTVQDIWVSDFDTSPDRQRDTYKCRLILRSEFYNEIKPQRSTHKQLAFNPEKSLLEFMGKQIEISKTRDSDPHYLLIVIFGDKDKTWSYDEIWDSKYFETDSPDWHKLYNAAYSVNEKVAKATTVSDFLNVTKTSISINKKYL